MIDSPFFLVFGQNPFRGKAPFKTILTIYEISPCKATQHARNKQTYEFCSKTLIPTLSLPLEILNLG
jgi:hypothetical protein